MPDPTTRVADLDVDDSTDDSPQAIVNRLTSVGRVNKQMNNRLSKIQAGFSIPPDDQKPPTLAALNEIKLQAAVATASADAMLALIGPIDDVGPG